MKINVFGIKEITFNNTVLYTFKISVKNTSFNEDEVKASGLDYFYSRDRIIMSYTTFDAEEFNRKRFGLGILLQRIAQHNLDSKYSWVI